MNTFTPYQQGYKLGIQYYEQCRPFNNLSYIAKKFRSPYDRIKFKRGFFEAYDFCKTNDIKINE